MQNFDTIVTAPGISRAFVDDFVARGETWIYDERLLFVKSTGTSGYHTLNVLTLDELAEISGLFLHRLAAPGRSTSRSAFLFGRDPSHLSYKFSCISVPYVSEAKHIATQQDVRDIVSQLEAFRPDVISSFPSTLRVVIEEVKAGRLRLGSGVTVLSSGEMLEPDLVAAYEQHLQTTPFNMYACIEASPIAQDCTLHRLHLNEDRFIAEADAGGGLVTNLMNTTVPVLRFRFDDLFEIDETPCACGSLFHRLTLSDAKRTGQFFIQDRYGELKKVNTMIFKDVLYQFPEVIQSQIEQTTPRHFSVRVYSRVASDAVRQTILSRLRTEMRKFAIDESELDLAVEFVAPEQMCAINGKVKHFLPWRWPSSDRAV